MGSVHLKKTLEGITEFSQIEGLKIPDKYVVFAENRIRTSQEIARKKYMQYTSQASEDWLFAFTCSFIAVETTVSGECIVDKAERRRFVISTMG